MASRKLFVGSLPNDITDTQLFTEFSKYGTVEDVFVKPGCDLGRQWAFVTMGDPQQAQHAKEQCDRILQFPGTERPCDVMVAKNQGMFGQDSAGIRNPPPASHHQAVAVAGGGGGARKVFVGSLPNTITDIDIRAEFSKYGHVLDVHINNKPCENGRNWAFVTFATAEQATACKVSADRVTMFPGSDRACEVTLARHQGMFGQEPGDGHAAAAARPVYAQPAVYVQPAVASGPKKVFVGSLPAHVNPDLLRAEFSRYGQVIDVHVNNKSSEPGRNWAFVTFASGEQASYAKDATDRVLVIPGADRPCEVMLAKNQGMNGQESLGGAPAPAAYGASYAPAAMPLPPGGAFQPPPPTAPPPPSLTPWRMYKTAAGLPYYHNHTTGQTQWECPPDLQVPGQGVYGAAVAAGPSALYSPY